VAKKAGAAKPKKGAKARAKKAATGEEAKQEQEERLAEAAPVSEGKLRSFLRLIKKDDKPKDQVQEAAKKQKASKPAVVKKEKRVARKEGRDKPKRNFFQSTAKYFQSVWGELKKVYWPSRRELVAYTMVVITAVVFVAALIWVADIILSKLLSLLLTLRL
jgi:preprotein translocase subunit SecE